LLESRAASASSLSICQHCRAATLSLSILYYIYLTWYTVYYIIFLYLYRSERDCDWENRLEKNHLQGKFQMNIG